MCLVFSALKPSVNWNRQKNGDIMECYDHNELVIVLYKLELETNEEEFYYYNELVTARYELELEEDEVVREFRDQTEIAAAFCESELEAEGDG